MLPDRIYEDMFENLDSVDMNCDIYEKNGNFHIEMDLPGYSKNEIKVEFHNGTIHILAKKEFNKEEHDGKRYLRRERQIGKVERSFYLGEVDEDKIDASFKDGILNLIIPSKIEANKKLISIK